MRFVLESPFKACGDQGYAIDALVSGLEEGKRAQTLLGITGSGKTFTIANVIERVQRPTLVIAPNKTLAGQLFNEFKELFPKNAVEYFVSYYDYYQPEAYVPSTNTFIEKDSAINDAIDRMRMSSTHSLMTRDDVIIVASVSCIYGLGTAEAYASMRVSLRVGDEIERDDFLRQLVGIQYSRSGYDFERGSFRVRGDMVEIFPAYESERAIRVQFFGDEVEGIFEIDPLRGFVHAALDKMSIFPASHYVVSEEGKHVAMQSIKAELKERLREFHNQGKLVELQRLEERTNFDLEMIATLGYCSGIENYSRHLTGRKVGEAPPCLLNYFPEDFLLVIDESHVAVPQIGGMYRADRSRKQTLVDYGFRLPSALDNRPLNFEEFEGCVNQVIYVSATPGDFEIEASEGEVIEQIIRPTGLLDPLIELRAAQGQVDDAMFEISHSVDAGFRVLVTTLTKRMAEDLTEYLHDAGMKVRYLHSDIDTLERAAILRDLRLGKFDVLVGINLLREGLDLPEVGLVVILDADKEGFLRSKRSLIQTIGRASRNSEGRVILYADMMTESMKFAVEETRRRRKLQEAYNSEHGIIPRTIVKKIHDIEEHIPADPNVVEDRANLELFLSDEEIGVRIEELRGLMRESARKLAFEEAALYRDRIKVLESRLSLG